MTVQTGPTQRARCALATVLAMLATAAQAGRPFATEDAGVLARGECEWESVGSRATSGDPVARGWTTQIGCGVGLATQLAVAYGRSHGAGSADRATTWAGKSGLVDGGDSGVALTLAYAATFVQPAQGRRQLDNHGLALVASQPFGAAFTGHANLGWQRDHVGRRSGTTWNLAVEYRLRDGLDTGAEWYGDDRTRPWLGTGLRWSVSNRLGLNGSYARRRGTVTEHLLTLGAKVTF